MEYYAAVKGINKLTSPCTNIERTLGILLREVTEQCSIEF